MEVSGLELVLGYGLDLTLGSPLKRTDDRFSIVQASSGESDLLDWSSGLQQIDVPTVVEG